MENGTIKAENMIASQEMKERDSKKTVCAVI